MDLSVLIPVWNEADNLEVLLPELHRTLTELALDYEILVVDAGSADGSRAVAEAHGARVLTQAEPGYGGALREGFAAARGDYILTMDGDYSHEPLLAARLWLERADADLVIASRYVEGGGASMPASRLALSRMLNAIYRRVLDLPVRDLSSGFRLYRACALRAARTTARNFDVLPEALVQLYAEGYRIREMPFQYRPRRKGRSHARLLRFGWAFLVTLRRMRRLRISIQSADYDARAYDSRVPLQRYWQRERHRIVTRFAEPGGRVLDVGCGSSRIILESPEMVGLDVALRKLRFLRGRVKRLLAGSLDALPFADGTFSKVICSEVIEHVPREKVKLSEFHRVLETGGVLVLGTPDYSSFLWRQLERVYRWVHPGGYADEHINPYTRESLARELESEGFDIVDLGFIWRSEMIFKARKRERPNAHQVRVPAEAEAILSEG
jgi:glycosyltransferase involved in cell wall biosynthesis